MEKQSTHIKSHAKHHLFSSNISSLFISQDKKKLFKKLVVTGGAVERIWATAKSDRAIWARKKVGGMICAPNQSDRGDLGHGKCGRDNLGNNSISTVNNAHEYIFTHNLVPL